MLKSQEKELKEMEENKEIINTPMGSVSLNINPGAKVEIIGVEADVKGQIIPKNPEFGFSVSQKLKNGNLAILAGEGIVLEVKPENVRNMK